MPVSRSGVTAPTGYNAQVDVSETIVTIVLAASATLVQGQVLCRDVTQIPGSAGADIVVKPSSGNAGLVVGVYGQSATITNPSSTATLTVSVKITTWGWTPVLVGVITSSGVAVTVGGNLITTGSFDYAIQGTAVFNKTIGMALATGAVVTAGATIVAVPGSGTTIQAVNAFVDCR